MFQDGLPLFVIINISSTIALGYFQLIVTKAFHFCEYGAVLNLLFACVYPQLPELLDLYKATTFDLKLIEPAAHIASLFLPQPVCHSGF